MLDWLMYKVPIAALFVVLPIELKKKKILLELVLLFNSKFRKVGLVSLDVD